MNIRFLQREEIPLIWQIDRREIVQNIYFLESKIIGSWQDTLQLKFLHVSRDYRKRGIASMLFKLAVEKAKELGAKKLYISATPSEHTVNYYRELGCVLAAEINPELFALEPEDIHLTYVIRSQQKLY